MKSTLPAVLLALNIGSSSLKYTLYELRHHAIGQQLESDSLPVGINGESVEQILDRLLQGLRTKWSGHVFKAVAHRVVHGGKEFTKSTVITAEVFKVLEGLISLAPLHQGVCLDGVRVAEKYFPQALQVACFDTAFHAKLPDQETHFALPVAFWEQGIRRYGFHGLSYQYVSQRLARETPTANQRLLMAHLGSGSSLCATVEKRSIATTMGFSTLDGLMMGTRCGSLDAGVVLHLMKAGWSYEALQHLLYHESGLKGVSGLSSDLRVLREKNTVDARLAINLYTHRILREIGALVACMQGVEVIAFCAGVGEKDHLLRASVIKRLSYLRVYLDEQANLAASQGGVCAIHTHDSRVEVWVVPTDENSMLAKESLGLLNGKHPG